MATPSDDAMFNGSVSVPEEVLVQELPDEELVFLDLRTESYFGLDRVGSKMYRALTETGSVHEAYERLTTEFDVEPGRLHSDFTQFVDRLRDQGIIDLVP